MKGHNLHADVHYLDPERTYMHADGHIQILTLMRSWKDINACWRTYSDTYSIEVMKGHNLHADVHYLDPVRTYMHADGHIQVHHWGHGRTYIHAEWYTQILTLLRSWKDIHSCWWIYSDTYTTEVMEGHTFMLMDILRYLHYWVTEGHTFMLMDILRYLHYWVTEGHTYMLMDARIYSLMGDPKKSCIHADGHSHILSHLRDHERSCICAEWHSHIRLLERSRKAMYTCWWYCSYSLLLEKSQFMHPCWRTYSNTHTCHGRPSIIHADWYN